VDDYFKQSQDRARAEKYAPALRIGLPPKIAITNSFLTQRASRVQRFAMEPITAIDALLEGDYAALKGRVT
jgi:hypothetical protein